MRKNIIAAILILINFLLIQNAYSQLQKNIPDYLKRNFLRYTKAVPREEIFIHFDREEYIAGEDLWFNIYVVDRQCFKPSLNSRIAYFELLNADNRPVVQKRILIDKGFGPGQIVLPDTLSAGVYTIRAYTSWMKNFLPTNCFMKNITVYNPFSTKAFEGKLAGSKSIVSDANNIINKGIKNIDVHLEVNNSKPDTLEIIVHTSNKFRSENNKFFYLFIQTYGNFNYQSTEIMTAETTKINIPKALLSAGINQLTVFNSMGKPVAERFIYTACKENNLLTFLSPDSCGLRNQITLELDFLKEVSTTNDSTNLSISVSPQTTNPQMQELNEYMLFGTEYGMQNLDQLNGRNIKELSSEVLDSILLHIQSNWINWETILSGDLPHFKFPMEKDDHFIFGKLVDDNQHAAHSDEFVILCTPGKEAVFQYAKTDGDGNFSFNIHIDQELKDLIIMPDDVSKNQRIVIESSFSDQFLPSTISVDSVQSTMPAHISKFSVNYQVSKIYGVSAKGKPVIPIFKLSKPIRFYGKPDIELFMADYISLPVMEEVFFELLPHVSLKKKKSNYEILITDRIDNTPYATTPSLLIDGVIIKDPSLIINLNPELVEKIDVIKEKYVVGKYFFPGIVNVITKTVDFSCISLPDYMIRMPYSITNPVLSFLSPDYSVAETKNNRIPDYRNTLYWNPTVKPDKDGKIKIELWSSDNKSDYVISIHGITQDGQFISQKKIIKVK